MSVLIVLCPQHPQQSGMQQTLSKHLLNEWNKSQFPGARESCYDLLCESLHFLMIGIQWMFHQWAERKKFHDCWGQFFSWKEASCSSTDGSKFFRTWRKDVPGWFCSPSPLPPGSLCREVAIRPYQRCWAHNQILMTVCFPSYMFIVLYTLIRLLVPHHS